MSDLKQAMERLHDLSGEDCHHNLYEPKALCIDCDIRLVLSALSRAEAELERERMRLAACGVVSMSNTPEAAAKARDMHADYRSASCDDAAGAVDREMAIRAERDLLAAECRAWRYNDECYRYCEHGIGSECSDDDWAEASARVAAARAATDAAGVLEVK